MANKDLSIALPEADYDAVVMANAVQQGWQPKIRTEKRETVDNPVGAEEYLKGRVRDAYLKVYIRTEVAAVGTKARTEASDAKELELNKKFKIS